MSMSKNELKSVAAIAFAQICLDKINVMGKNERKVLDKAYHCFSKSIDHSRYLTVCRWLNQFEQETFGGRKQEAHTYFSFAIAILERQSSFLKGKKLDAFNQLISLLTSEYEKLEKPDNPEFCCNDMAAFAVEKWEGIIENEAI